MRASWPCAFASRAHAGALCSIALAAALLGETVEAGEPQWTIEGYVVHVGDGETVMILDKHRLEHRVRIDGIDAPEKEQPFGAAARRHLYDLTYGLDVVARCHKIDQSKYDICQLWVGKLDVGLAMLRAGLAWYDVRHADELSAERQASYGDAHQRAKLARAGLWSAELTPVPPWEWRGVGGRLPGS